jgi:hypothetical protein
MHAENAIEQRQKQLELPTQRITQLGGQEETKNTLGAIQLANKADLTILT